MNSSNARLLQSALGLFLATLCLAFTGATTAACESSSTPDGARPAFDAGSFTPPDVDSGAKDAAVNPSDAAADAATPIKLTGLQEAYIKASNARQAVAFGNAVALSADGNTLAVGCRLEGSPATGINGDQTLLSADGSGAVYVFARVGATWTQQAYVKPSNTLASAHFGTSVALSADGNTLAVGSPNESSATKGINGIDTDTSAPSAGAAYVFARVGVTWSQQAYVKASNANMYNLFGFSVALSADGNTLAAGSYEEAGAATGVNGSQAVDGAAFAGAVYVFSRVGSTWTQQAYVKASNTRVNLTDSAFYFGWSVALSGDGNTLAVGARGEPSAAIGIGGNQADTGALDSGAVYVFARVGVTWSQQAYVKASNTHTQAAFGCSVSLSADGSTLAAGSWGEYSAAMGLNGDQADVTAYWAGAVYLFSRVGSAWAQQAYLKASNTRSGANFGYSVGLAAGGDTLAVSARTEGSGAKGINGNQADISAPGAGAVYVVR
jgi:hypothetical protein